MKIETPVLDARLIVQHVLGVEWDTLFLGPDRPLTETERARLDEALARRALREPVARIVGKRHFWTLNLAVSPATLDPRSDTETVVEAALAAVPDRERPLRVLDLGTGTGALLLALLAEFPTATGVGVDRSADAIAVAQANAESHFLAERAGFLVGNWADSLAERFDLVVANPPYIPRSELALLPAEVREYDPVSALDGGPDGLDAHRQILGALPLLLAPGGLGVVEIGAGQAIAVRQIAVKARLSVADSRCDLGGIERALVLREEFR